MKVSRGVVSAIRLATVVFSLIAFSAVAAEPVVRLPGYVFRDGQGDSMGVVTAITSGEIQFFITDPDTDNPISMAYRRSGSNGPFLFDTMEFVLYYSGLGCTGTVYLGEPAIAKPIHSAMSVSYGIGIDPLGSGDLLIYRGTGTGAVNSVQSRWQLGGCIDDTAVFNTFTVAATPILNFTDEFPAPHKVEPHANPIAMTLGGDVGVGTLAPAERFHLFEDVNANTLLTVENPDSGLSAAAALRSKSDTAVLNFQAHGSGRTISRFGQTLASWNEMLGVAGNGFIIGTIADTPLILGTNSANRIHIKGSGFIGVGTTTPGHPLQMASGAHVTVGGVWTNASSRELKTDVRELDAASAFDTLGQLDPVTYRYRSEDEPYVGFIAEDVPDLVAMKDRRSLSPMDLVAVLTKVVQEQQRQVEEQRQTIEELLVRVQALESSRD